MNDSVDRERGLAGLQSRLGHRFDDTALLARALTHRSAGSDNNERLEFLGDGVLNFVVAAALFDAWRDAPEGDLSRLRAALVRESTLAEIADELALSELLIVGPGETSGGSRRRDSIRADAVEALLGAVYRDAGFAAAQHVIEYLYGARLNELPRADSLKDAKTQLQEWLQARGRTRPAYALVGAWGADHERRYAAECRLPDRDEIATRGEGTSRRQAEQSAAERMLDQIRRAAGP